MPPDAAPAAAPATPSEIPPARAVSSDDDLSPVGSCRMGIDPPALVDHRLRIVGIEGLRVVDASATPTAPSGNTYAATMMVAEKAVDTISEDEAG